MKKIKCVLFIGTSTGRFMKWGEFESISDAKQYVRDCISCYHEIRRKDNGKKVS